jgi:hypothetical protein
MILLIAALRTFAEQQSSVTLDFTPAQATADGRNLDTGRIAV